jgi:hypothetical protein
MAESDPRRTGLIERGSGEVEVESARGISDVAGQVPALAVQPIETAELKPGSAVLGRGGEIVTEKFRRRAALSTPVHRDGAGDGARVYRRLCGKAWCPGEAGGDERGSETKA